jgi:hypothetical protein
MYYKGAAAALLCCDLSGEREGGIERGREVRLGVGREGGRAGREVAGGWMGRLREVMMMICEEEEEEEEEEEPFLTKDTRIHTQTKKVGKVYRAG